MMDANERACRTALAEREHAHRIAIVLQEEQHASEMAQMKELLLASSSSQAMSAAQRSADIVTAVPTATTDGTLSVEEQLRIDSKVLLRQMQVRAGR